MNVLFKHFMQLCLIALAVGVLVGCGEKATKEETKTVNYEKDDFEISLPVHFEEKGKSDVTYYFESDYATLSVDKQEFTSFDNEWVNADATINDFIDYTMMNDQLTGNEVTSREDTATFSYESNIDGTNTYNYVYAAKGEDAFWLCTFTCNLNEKDNYVDQFKKWLDLAVFK